MAVMKKGLAVFLVVIAAVSTIAISAFADDLSPYTVETYFMNTNGAYASEPDSTDREYVNVGSEVQIQFEEHEGFTVDSAKSDSSVIVAEDGSTVAKIYYQRNKYTLTYYYEDLVGPQSEEAEVYYGAEIPAFEANPSGKPAKTGYNFIMWSTVENERTEAPDTMPANDVDLYPIYELKTFTYTFDAGEGGSFPDGEQIHSYEYSYGDTPVRPDDPAREHYEFADWDVDLPSFVDGDITFEAMYNEKCYTVYFYNGEELISACDGYYFGDWFEAIDAPEGYDAWTLEDGTDVEFPYEINGDTYFYVSEVENEYSDYLGLKTELYTYDETLGDWVVADKVGRNQEVKARVFIETGFAAGDGQVLFFYNDDAFESDYVGNLFPIDVNTSETSTTGQCSVNGMMASPSKFHDSMKTMIEHGYFTEEFLENNTPVTFSFYFTDYKCHQISGDEWFAEFTLRTKSDAVGEGDFFIVPATIQNPDEGYFAYTTFSRGESEGASALDYTLGMDEWEATLEVESNPVSTGYGRIKLDAGKGIFSSTQTNSVSYDFTEGSEIEITEEPSCEGYVFAGYESEIPAVMTADVYTLNALWTPADNTPFNVTIHYYDFSSGITLKVDEDIVLLGTTDNRVEFVEVVPDNPDENTEYIPFSYLTPDFNQVDFSADNILSTVIAPDGSSSLEIYFKPVVHEVVFDADGGTFADGSTSVTLEVTHGDYLDSYTLPENPTREGYGFSEWYDFDETARVESDLVIKPNWIAIPYYLTLNVDKGIETFVYSCDETVDPNIDTYKEGYSLVGWIDEDGYFYSELPETMPARDLTLTASYKKNTYTVTFKANGGKFEDGNSVIVYSYEYSEPIEITHMLPVRDGYHLAEWVMWINNDNIHYYFYETNFGLMPACDVVIEAVWVEINYYKLSFESTGDVPEGIEFTGPVNPLEAGEQIALIPEPSVEGYIFDGWYYEGKHYAPGSIFTMPTQDVVMTCHWVKIPEETTTQPTTTEPEVTEIITTKPVVTEPETTKTPVITEPSTTKPTTTKPTTTTTKPTTTTTKPATTKPVVTETTTVKPTTTTTKPVVTETTTAPATTKPVVTEPETTKPAEPTTKPQTAVFEIRQPSLTTIKYGDSIILHADVVEGERPQDVTIEWTADNGNFTILSVSEDGSTCTVTPNTKGDTVFTITVFDKDGNEIGSDTQKMTSKAGFFQKIIAFFKKIFGLTKVYPQAFKDVI